MPSSTEHRQESLGNHLLSLRLTLGFVIIPGYSSATGTQRFVALALAAVLYYEEVHNCEVNVTFMF
jgi:hypothetical protein